MSDNYAFMKATESQDADDYSPYIDKQYGGQYINDINNGVYTNNSLTLVNFDLGQIYNSEKFTETSELFAVLPITMVAAFADSTNALVAPVPGNINLCTIKTNFINLIHQADLQINGKTIESTQPYINVARHFQMISELGENDLSTIGYTMGFSETLDNPKAVRYDPAYASSSSSGGNGLSNNMPFRGPTEHSFVGDVKQNATACNIALQNKSSRYLDTTAGGTGATTLANNIVGTLVTVDQLAKEYRPYYTVNGNYMIWHDYAVIKLNHVFESLNKIGLVKKFDASVRLWINTGTVDVDVTSANNAAIKYNLIPSNNTFSNTCPLMISQFANATGGIPAGVTSIVAGLYISKPPVTSFAGVNLANSAASHPLSNCRLYYPQITVNHQLSLKYVAENQNKKVIYRTFVNNTFNNISSGSSFNALVNSGIIHPTGVLICPFIGAVPNSGFGDYQWKSPFDTCPATTAPLSLTNLQVTIGGTNVLQSTLSYNYEHFISQTNLVEQLTSSDIGVATGLINQQYWEWSKWYYVNVERSNTADKLLPRNVNVSFNNNSNVPIDVLIFIFYSDELEIDVATGIVTK